MDTVEELNRAITELWAERKVVQRSLYEVRARFGDLAWSGAVADGFSDDLRRNIGLLRQADDALVDAIASIDRRRLAAHEAELLRLAAR